MSRLPFRGEEPGGAPLLRNKIPGQREDQEKWPCRTRGQMAIFTPFPGVTMEQQEPKPPTPAPSPASGACDHFQPGDLAVLAEEYLRAKAVPEDRWEGSRFRYGAGGGTGPFKA